MRAIREALSDAERAGQIALHVLPTATREGLRNYLQRTAGERALPHLLHFDGHGVYGRVCRAERGDGAACNTFNAGRKPDVCRVCRAPLPSEREGYLLFEGERGPDYVRASEFGEMLHRASLGDDQRPTGLACVVLSACRSALTIGQDSVYQGVAQSLIDHQVPAVVAMRQRIRVDAAASFARGFYEALAARRPLGAAVAIGRQTLADDQWYRPVLYLRWADNAGGELYAPDTGGFASPSWLAARVDAATRKLESYLAGIHGEDGGESRQHYIDTTVRERVANSGDAPAAFPLGDLHRHHPGTTSLVIGHPGSGKTTALYHLAATAAQAAAADTTAPIPAYVPLNRVDSAERVLERVFALVARDWRTDADTVEKAWRDGARPILFLLDAFNEVAAERRDACLFALEDLTDEARHTNVVTTRTGAENELDLGPARRVTQFDMVPLSDSQLRVEMRRRGLGAVFPTLSRPTLDMISNPYLLSLALQSQVRNEAPLSGNIGSLHTQFIEHIFAGWEQRKRASITRFDYRAVKRPVLGLLAERMTSRDEVRAHRDSETETVLRTELRRIDAEFLNLRAVMPPQDEWTVDGFLSECEQNGLLRVTADAIEFVHQSLRDYFTATHLEARGADVDQLLGLVPEEQVDLSSKSKPRRATYADAIVLYSGLLDDSSALVAALVPKRPLLASRCFAASAAVDEDTQDALTARLIEGLRSDVLESVVDAMACIAAAGLDRPELTDAIVENLTSADDLIAGNAVLNLGRLLGRRSLVPLLETILQSAEGRMATALAAQILVNTLGLDDDVLMRSSLIALGLKRAAFDYAIDPKDVARAALARLSQGMTAEQMIDEFLRPGEIDLAFESATMALRLGMRDAALEQLAAIARNRDESSDRRKQALGAICRLGYSEVECGELVRLLEDDDEDVSMRVWTAGCLCYVVSQSRLSQEFSDDAGFPGLEPLTRISRDRGAPAELRAEALQGLVCSWRDGDFDTALALIGDTSEEAEFRGRALMSLPRHMANPLPSWLCHFSAVQQVRDLLFREGTGDEETQRRWGRVCALVVEQILMEDDGVHGTGRLRLRRVEPDPACSGPAVRGRVGREGRPRRAAKCREVPHCSQLGCRGVESLGCRGRCDR